MRRITVGPESAGSNPGPACYARGGDAPTVTDADVVIGKIDPERFAGGKVPMEPARAAMALDRVVGEPLDMTTQVAAAGVSEIVTENMANAARVHAIENGMDTADRTLIAFGGAAPLHATRLAGKLGISQIIIPQGAGVGSAVGFLRAPIAYEVVRTRFMALPHFDAGLLNEIFADMRAEAEAVVRLGAEEREIDTLTETRTAFMRYRGQGHEIAVTLPVRAYEDDDREKFDAAFDAEYSALYSRTIPNLEVEILTWTLSLGTARPLPAACAPPRESYNPDPVSHRAIFDPDRGAEIKTAIYPRDDLQPGATIAGPSVIVEDETSTLVSDGFTATINTLGQIVLTKEEQAP